MSGRRDSRAVPPTRRKQWSRFRLGLVAIVALIVPIYLAFTKDIPFTHGYQVTAVFETANNLRPGSPVRIAGVNVGEVKEVGRYKDTDYSYVKMEIDDEGLPIHEDATLKIRPRIFLEGNFFVDVKPGTPGSGEVESGGTIGVAQTSTPVQLDELLTALQSDSREDLQILLKEYGAALSSKPTAEQDEQLPPEVRGLTGAEAINRSYDAAGPALKGAAVVGDALLGEDPRDIARTIAAIGRLSRGLEGSERQLQDLIVNLNLTAAAFANQSGALSDTLRLLPATLSTARASLRRIDDALPTVRAFAKEILPGVRQTAATVDASFPWIAQTRALLGPDELQGLMRELTPTTSDLARLTSASLRLLPEINRFSQCFSKVILPTGNVGLQDGALTTRRADGSIVESYKEFWYGLVGMTSAGQGFDGNGAYLRASAGGGEWQVLGGVSRYLKPAGGSDDVRTLIGNHTEQPRGTRPLYPATTPTVRTDVPCHQSRKPDLNGPQAGPGAPPQNMQIPTPPPYRRPLPPGATTPPAAPVPAAAGAGENAGANTSLGARLLSRLNPLAGGETR
ncbi:MlaD family protein [Conexibacter arvalis]|uniref:Virulence factor Mce-like protein n=1 Tax=Conexibacter arvalis TaxID=912552 RepID=A0A840ICL0_9ACTN|nr:MlaD family protein [Conexibacter arvalis]MBB4662677.1 virulence factor Mce-like protein [Conexibacter arvalis]